MLGKSCLRGVLVFALHANLLPMNIWPIFCHTSQRGKTNTMQCERLSKSRPTWPAMQTLFDNMRKGALAFWVYKPHQAYLCTHSWLPFGDISLTLRAVLKLAFSSHSLLGKRIGCSNQHLLFSSWLLLLLFWQRKRFCYCLYFIYNLDFSWLETGTLEIC